MKNITGSLGFRLTAASFIVVFVFIFVAGIVVIKISHDAVKAGLTDMVATMAMELPREQGVAALSAVLSDEKLRQTRSAWIMDSSGVLLFHPDSRYRAEYVATGSTAFGNVRVDLQFASPRPPGTGSFKEKMIDVLGKYDQGFGEYRQFGETRLLAFRVIREKRWLVGVDAPAATANSELERIKKYIRITGFISAALILAFTWLAIKIIVRPYYREVEDLNRKLQDANRRLTDSNLQMEASNRKITALYTISITMQETMALEDILDLIVGGAKEVLEVDRINIMLPDRSGSYLECRAVTGAGEKPTVGLRVPLTPKGGALAAAYKRAQVIRVNQGEHVPPQYRLAPPLSAEPFLRSSAFVVLPMVVKNKSVGVIAIDNKVSRAPLTDDMVNLIQIFANQAAVAVENARLYDELKRNIEELDRRVDQLSIVNQISNTMQHMVKKKEMLGFILRGIKESMGFDQVTFCRLDQQEGFIRGEVGVGVNEERLLALAVPAAGDRHLLPIVARRGVPAGYVTSRDVDLVEGLALPLEESGWSEVAGGTAAGAGAAALVPVRVIDDIVGLIAVARRKRDTTVAKKELELLLMFANTAGLAVERAGLYERLQAGTEVLAVTDHVTKLFTFSYGQQRAAEELQRARESSRPLSVLMMGIDGFMEFNERYGQEAGDQVLGEVGHLVKMVTFDADLPFRYAGRLTACLLPGRSLSEAQAIAEKLRRIVGDHRFPGPGDRRERKLTVSVGVLEHSAAAGPETPAGLFAAAVALLRRAEAAGGNQVVSG